MKNFVLGFRSIVFACAASVFAIPALADMTGNVSHAVNFFQNGKYTNDQPMTVDVKGPVEISDMDELPGFAFHVYDVDFTANSLTMTLVAQLEKLQVTRYDETTFDRY